MSFESLKPNWQRRKPMKRGGPLKRKTPISPISNNKEKRKRRFVPEAMIKQVHARAGGFCEFVNESGIRCQNPAQHQPHHRKKRSQGGKHTFQNLAACCAFHNDWAERFKTDSVKLGWTII